MRRRIWAFLIIFSLVAGYIVIRHRTVPGPFTGPMARLASTQPGMAPVEVEYDPKNVGGTVSVSPNAGNADPNAAPQPMIPVPEPVTLSLLALGTPWLLRRRK